jgi:hypothetical protein
MAPIKTTTHSKHKTNNLPTENRTPVVIRLKPVRIGIKKKLPELTKTQLSEDSSNSNDESPDEEVHQNKTRPPVVIRFKKPDESVAEPIHDNFLDSDEEEEVHQKKTAAIPTTRPPVVIRFKKPDESVAEPIHDNFLDSAEEEGAAEGPSQIGDESSIETDHEDLSDSDLTEEEKFDLVRNLYLDETFPGSFSGVINMERQIFLIKHIYISRKIIAKALRSIPSYLMHLSPVRKYPTGHFEATTIGENVQGTTWILRQFININLRY